MERTIREGGTAGDPREPSPAQSGPPQKEELCVDQEAHEDSGEIGPGRKPKSSDRRSLVVAHPRVPGAAGRTDATPRIAKLLTSNYSRPWASVRQRPAVSGSEESCVADADVGTASQRRVTRKVPPTTQKLKHNGTSSTPSATNKTKHIGAKAASSGNRSKVSDTRSQPQSRTGKSQGQQRQQVATENLSHDSATAEERDGGDNAEDMKLAVREAAAASPIPFYSTDQPEDGKGVPDGDYTETSYPGTATELGLDSSLVVAADGLSRPQVEDNSGSTYGDRADNKNIDEWKNISSGAVSKPVEDQDIDQVEEPSGKSKNKTTGSRKANLKKPDLKNRVIKDKAPCNPPATDDGLVRSPHSAGTNSPRAGRKLLSAPLSPKRGADSSPRPRKSPAKRQICEKKPLAGTVEVGAACPEQMEGFPAEAVNPEVDTGDAVVFSVSSQRGNDIQRTDGAAVLSRAEATMSPADDLGKNSECHRGSESGGPLNRDIGAGPGCGPAPALTRAERSSSSTACVDALVAQQRGSRYSAAVEEGIDASSATIGVEGEQKSETSRGQTAARQTNFLSGERQAFVDKDNSKKDKVKGNSHPRVSRPFPKQNSIRQSSPRGTGLGARISGSAAPATHGENIGGKKKAVGFASALTHRARAPEGRGGKSPTQPRLHARGFGLDENRDVADVNNAASEINARDGGYSLAPKQGYVEDGSNESKLNISIEELVDEVVEVEKSGEHQSVLPSSGKMSVGPSFKRRSQDDLHNLDNNCVRTAGTDVVEQRDEHGEKDCPPSRDIGRLDVGRTDGPSGLMHASDFDQEAYTAVADGSVYVDSGVREEGEGTRDDRKRKVTRKPAPAVADNERWPYGDTTISEVDARDMSELELLRGEVSHSAASSGGRGHFQRFQPYA